MSTEQHGGPQTHRELDTNFSVQEACSDFPTRSHCSKSCVSGSVTTHQLSESSATHKQLLKCAKVVALDKTLLQLHASSGTKGETTERNVEPTGKQFLSSDR